jgi:hypothetical protein
MPTSYRAIADDGDIVKDEHDPECKDWKLTMEHSE